MSNNTALVNALVDDFFGLQAKTDGNAVSRVLDMTELMNKVREFANTKEPSDDGCYYVNKSEVLKATGLTEDEYKDFCYKARNWGYWEPTGKWFRIIDMGGTLGIPLAPGVSVQGGPGMGVSSVNGSMQLSPVVNVPTQDYDMSCPNEGDMYYNTKLQELRISINGQWMAVSMAPATPCP